MIDAQTLENLENMEGLIYPEEGRKLAELASKVPSDQLIVEVGSHRGLSSSWLAAGSMDGFGAQILCVDLWSDQTEELDEVWPENRGAFQAFESNVASIGASNIITPIRASGEEAAKFAETGAGPAVGMFFHDADHSYEAVSNDFLAWLPHLVDNAVYACHDYWENLWVDGGWQRTENHQMAIEEVILPTSKWTEITITNSLWSGRRA